jgi:addiction module HigA family antidote
VTRQQLYNAVAGRSGITSEMSSRLEKGVGSTDDAWLGMQAAYDLAQLRRSEWLLI